MNKLLAVLFGISCFATSAISSSMLGVGMWFWIILGAGIFVAASQFVPVLRELGGGVAMILATISVLAVILTLLAATTGGSFNLGDGGGLLVFSFALIAIFGFSLALVNRKITKLSNSES